MLSQETKSLSELDQEIDALERQLLELKNRRNMLRPLCRLPAEIIGHILHHSQIPLRDHRINSRYIETRFLGTFDRRWTEYTHVCRYIRSVAIDTPKLWSFIQLNFGKAPSAWSELCARRAKDCLLEIYAPSDYMFRGTDAGAQLMKYLGKARRLETYLQQGDSARHAVALRTSMPVMEEMWCGMGRNRLDAQFMGGSSSSLLKLSLYDFTFALHESSPAFTALRSLELVHRSNTHEIRQFVILLNHTPSIEALHISISPSPILINENDALSPVSLSHLRAFHLSASLEAILLLTGIVPTPRDSLSIHVTGQTVRPGDRPVSDLHTYMLRFWSDVADAHPFPRGRIKWTNYTHCKLEIGSEFAFESDTVTLNPRIFFYCRYFPTNPVLIPQMLELVDSLHIRGRLQSFHEEMFDALSHHVRHLVVKSVKFVTDLPQGLDSWVRKRARDGCPLETAAFERCVPRGSEGDMQEYVEQLQLNRLVENVEWRESDTPQ